MADIPIAAMKAVAERLDGLGLDYAFLGGSIVGLLLELKGLVQREARAGYPPVMSVFSRGTIVYGEAIGIQRDSHIFVGLEDSDKYLFGSRIFECSKILWLGLPHVRTIQEISAKLPLPRHEIDLLLHHPGGPQ